MSAQINLDNRALLPPDTYLKDALIDWERNPGFPLVQVTRQNELLTVEQKVCYSVNIKKNLSKNFSDNPLIH